eukprot:m.169212 g.169212  ORF g.169212 m.169212 type:complete len:152 (+) comp24156_c0_seq6:1338-1793(+)
MVERRKRYLCGHCKHAHTCVAASIELENRVSTHISHIQYISQPPKTKTSKKQMRTASCHQRRLAHRREREKSPSLTQDWHRTRDAVWPQQGHRIADTAISTIPGRATWFQSDLSDMCCQEYNNGDNTDTHLPLTQHLSLNPLSGLAAPSQV